MPDRDSDMVLVPRELLIHLRQIVGIVQDEEEARQVLPLIKRVDSVLAAPSATAPTDEARLRQLLATELLNEHGDNVNMRLCIAYVLGESDGEQASQHDKRKLDASLAALRRVSLSAPREEVYRAALEEIASGLSVENPFDIANRALKETKP